MIERIIRIRNVGKFADYSAQGDTSFRPLTLIFAENARGKTTMTSFLRSLHTGSPRLVHERRTIGSKGRPEIQLRISGANIIFGARGWISSYPNMVIFDATFVTQNVYSGDEIQHNHRRNLHRFAVGEVAVQLATRLDKIAKDIRAINTYINSAKNQIQSFIQGQIDVDDFIALPPIEDIDELITNKEKELAAFTQADEIRQKAVLLPVLLPNIDFNDLTTLLGENLTNISTESEQRIKDHIASCGTDSEAWLGQGIQHIENERCPFCGQSLTGLELIEAYKGYFSEAYKEFKQKINESLEAIDTTLSQHALLSLQRAINQNQSLTDYWLQYCSISLPPIEFEDIAQKMQSLREVCRQLLDAKAAAPLEEITPNETFDEAQTAYSASKMLLEAYSQNVEQINVAINEKKQSIESGNKSEIEAALRRLRDTKNRHTDEVTTSCQEYSKLKKQKDDLERNRDVTRQELLDTTEDLLHQYQTKINDYLAHFAADFRITNATEQHYGGGPRLQYYLSIRDENIPLDGGDESGPTFKNTLSSGDRTTLALALFLARLDADNSIERKIIVFDDPLSSLDSNRKNQTRQEILRLTSRAEQVIVLSHNPYFLRLLWEGTQNKENIKTLAITRSGNNSTLGEWDIDNETRGDYYRNYSALIEYREHGPSGDLRNVARCIRPLLEGNLRMRFPGQFAGCTLGVMLGRIREAETGSPLMPLQTIANDINDINEYTKRYHHADNPNASNEPISDQELSGYVDRILSALGGIFASDAN